MRRLLPLALVLALATSACLVGLKLPGEEGRPCGAGESCLPGFECRAGVCEQSLIGRPCDFVFDDCERGFCYFSAAADAFCTIACSASSQCPAGFRCADRSEDGAFVCLPPSLAGGSVGSAALGDPCLLDDDCQSGFCESEVCADTCQRQDDCGGDGSYECQVVSRGGRSGAFCGPTAASGGLQGEVCADSAECARGVCADNSPDPSTCSDPCCSSADCPPGHICWLVTWADWQRGDGLPRTCVEFQSPGSTPIGDPCVDDYDCARGSCVIDPQTERAACSDVCCTDADCGAGYRCEPIPYDVDDDGTDDSYLPFCVTRP
ncbi:MAG: hypothetical protein P1V51_23395 [Deltaproteobacteria bacterium]|nr:hypothetical protein [Deltaproteobacteria bacterium]